MKGYQIAYILKKRNPQLYERAKTIKENYKLKWDEAIRIAKGEIPEPMTLEDLTKRLEALEEAIKTINEVKSTLHDKVETCKFIDSNGYCRYFNWLNPPPHWDVVEEEIGNRKVYHVNVRKHMFICLGCTHWRNKFGYF